MFSTSDSSDWPRVTCEGVSAGEHDQLPTGMHASTQCVCNAVQG